MVRESLIKEVDIPVLIKALRHCVTRSNGCVTCAGCPMSSENGDVIGCINALHKDAAAAIDALQAEIAELKRVNMEIFEDLPKLGEWIERHVFNDREDAKIPDWQEAKCSVCGKWHTTPYMYCFVDFDYCPNCGAKMGGRK